MEMLRIPRSTPAPAPIAEVPSDAPAMEIAHVLFMDVVGFSQLRMQQQAAIQVELQNLVQATAEVQQARKDNKLIVRLTGDGMALVFLRDMLSPVRCALQLQTLIQAQDVQIRQRIGSPIRLRMGIHSGSVLMVEDMNAQSDVAGEGIIIAQRVMDCGDAGHILLSADVASKMLNIDPWPRYLTDIGAVRVKHGVKLHLFNLYARLDGPFCGNPAVPKKVKEDSAAQVAEQKQIRGTFFERNPEAKKWITALALLAFLGGGGYMAWTKVPQVPTMTKAAFASASTFLTNLGKQEETPSLDDPKETSGGKKSQSAQASTKNGGGTGSSSSSYTGNESKKVYVPDVTGRTFSEAKAILKAEGLTAKNQGTGYNSDYGRDLIYRQYPEPGQMVSLNSSVKVRISKGDAPTKDTPTPPEPSLSDPEPTNSGEGGSNEESILGDETPGEGGDETAMETSEEPRLRRPGPLRRAIRERAANRSGGNEE